MDSKSYGIIGRWQKLGVGIWLEEMDYFDFEGLILSLAPS
jgi:hypothetical protein